MQHKKGALLRWVNCFCNESMTIERIQGLSNGVFFHHILKSLRDDDRETITSEWLSPWFVQISNILTEHNVEEDAVDFNLAAAGNEDELSKLIIICMYLTMVKRPCETIKEKTISTLSVDDQKVIKAVLLEIVHDDKITRNRLFEVLRETDQEPFSNPMTPITFYASSPLSSMPRSSPLKRFLDSPMAMRLSRVQKELHDKNEEIRRLQSELVAESDEASSLKRQVEELLRRLKEMEAHSSALKQRLNEYQTTDNSSFNADAEIALLRKQLKKLQSECEAANQRCCDLRLENEELITQKEKDWKQIRQMQLEMKDAVARFEQESGELRRMLDSTRTDNTELKHALEEKAKWIDVLEERNRASSEQCVHFEAPRSPCEKESIGFSLLSIEAEKLKNDLECCQKELAVQYQNLECQKKLFSEQIEALSRENSSLSLRLEEVTTAKGTLQSNCEEAKLHLAQLAEDNQSLRQQKDQLQVFSDALQAEKECIAKEMDVRGAEVMKLNRQNESLEEHLQERLKLMADLEQSFQSLSDEKGQLEKKLFALETTHEELVATHASNLRDHKHELENLHSVLATRHQELAECLESINSLRQADVFVRQQLTAAEERGRQLEKDKSQLLEEKIRLEKEGDMLRTSFDNFRQESRVQLEALGQSLKEATTRIEEFQLKNDQLEKEKASLEIHSRTTIDELQSKNGTLLKELTETRDFLAVQTTRINEMEERSEESKKQMEQLESAVRNLKQENSELQASQHLSKTRIEELVQQSLQLNNQTAELTGEKNKLIEEKESLLAEINRLESSLVEQKDAHASTVRSLEVEMETKARLSVQEIREVEAELARVTLSKESLASQVEQLSMDRCELLERRKQLDQELVDLNNSLSREKEDFDHRVQQLVEQLEAARDASAQMESKISHLHTEREHLQTEKSSLEQMYLNSKAAWETAEAQMKLESDMALQELEAKNRAIEELERALAETRHEQEVSASSHALRLETLESEKSSLSQKLEEVVAERLAERAETERQIKLLEEAENQKLALTVNFEELEHKLKATSEKNEQLSNEMTELKMAHERAQHALRDEVDRCQKQVDGEREHQRALEAKLDESSRSMADIQLEVEQLKSELQELSLKKRDVEHRVTELEESMTTSEAAARYELTKVLQESESKSATITSIEAQLQDASRGNEELRARLEEVERAKKEITEAAKIELDSLQQQMEELQATVTQSFSQVEEEKAAFKRSLEEKERKSEELVVGIASSKQQFEAVSALRSQLEEECSRLKADYQRIQEEKALLEQRYSTAQASISSVQAELDAVTSSMDSKALEVIQLRSANDALKLQAEDTVRQREQLEHSLSTKEAELSSAIKTVNQLREENQAVKAALEAEKSKAVQLKGEIALEHRKEKAALEARLQLAQSQLKSMQEKLVNMTVANQSQELLEQKVTYLTSELEAASNAKIELDKKLKEAAVPAQVVKPVKTAAVQSIQQAESASEVAVLRKKYDTIKMTLGHKDDVIDQYAAKFEKMQLQLDAQNTEVSKLVAENRKLAFENRSLKTEQQHLLAQMAAEKDKLAARNSRHTLALQRGISEGGTLADTMMEARRRTLRPSRSEVSAPTSRKPGEPSMGTRKPVAEGAGDDSIFKIPSSRRESTSSLCSTSSRGMNVPHGAGRLFSCDDEDGELFSSSYLNEMKEGICTVDNDMRRVSELHRRNTLQPPHMRSAYPVEMNDENLRRVDIVPTQDQSTSKDSAQDSHNESMRQLSFSTSLLSVNTPPAYNTRKRTSNAWNESSFETPVNPPRKRRSYELDADLSVDSMDSRNLSNSIESRKRRDVNQTAYKRPGPPTPGRNSLKENVSSSSISVSSPPKVTPKQSGKAESKRATSPAAASRSAKVTPASLVRKMQSKLRSNKQSANEQTTPSTTPRGRSKLNIFRKPLGSRGYNSDAKF